MNINEKYEGEPGWVKRMEFKLDRYNHLMELMRTCLGACTLILQVVILLKLFIDLLKPNKKYRCGYYDLFDEQVWG